MDKAWFDEGICSGGSKINIDEASQALEIHLLLAKVSSDRKLLVKSLNQINYRRFYIVYY